MKFAFRLIVILGLGFWSIGSLNDRADKKNYVGEPKQEECGVYTGGGWDQCMLNMIETNSLLIK